MNLYGPFERDGKTWKNRPMSFPEQVAVYQIVLPNCYPESYIHMNCANSKPLQAAFLYLNDKGIRPEIKGLAVNRAACDSPLLDIEVGSIELYDKPLDYDLVYCNKTMNYVPVDRLGGVMEKLRAAKVIISRQVDFGDYALSEKDPKGNPIFARPVLWWLEEYAWYGFKAFYLPYYHVYVLQKDEPVEPKIYWERFLFSNSRIISGDAELSVEAVGEVRVEGVIDPVMDDIIMHMLKCGRCIIQKKGEEYEKLVELCKIPQETQLENYHYALSMTKTNEDTRFKVSADFMNRTVYR